MIGRNGIFKPYLLFSSILLIFLLAGCVQTAESCPSFSPFDLSEADTFARDDNLPFQFPLNDNGIFTSGAPFSTNFASFGRTTRGPEYHAAEDILQPAGTPVYAMADGMVSFSGLMGGYGWLIIIDHPQANGRKRW
jgi:murein DD-endopeptidase MepM/ murein hydrolase activator NlpD